MRSLGCREILGPGTGKSEIVPTSLEYDVSTSENGWPVLERAQLHWFTAAGSRFAAANADVAYLAAYLINHFNSEVETLSGPVLDDWSWASRPVREQVSGFSNHASASAWDLNATKHPRGVHGTFAPDQIAAVRKILAKLTDDAGNHVFRWGNDYAHSPIDAMHFEINLTRAQVAQATRKLRASLADETDHKPQEDDVSFQDKHKLTAWDVACFGNPERKVGDEISYDELLRNPPAGVRLRRELDALIEAQAERDKAQIARDAEQAARITALTARVAELAQAIITIGSSAKATG